MNKIGWCDMTWNPVWGCRNHCEYCYARNIAKRFGGIQFRKEWEYRTEHNTEYADIYFKLKNSLDLINFKPSFLYSQFNKKLPKKPQRIFVGSMSEIAHWEKEWVERVIEKTKQYPQHTFQFLTKFPAVYGNYKFPENCWLGITLISEMAKENCWSIAEFESHNKENLKFISIEPLMEKIDLKNCIYSIKNINWVIVGAETGNRKGKIIPKLEWIDNIIYYCRKYNIPIYLKDSLKYICPSLWKIIPINKKQPSILSYKPIKEFPKRK